MNKKKQGLILSILGILSILIITGGVTYAFFNYAKTGTTDNIITTGSITFLYTEVDKVGNGINIQNAFPISDEVGKKISKTNEYFDFKITSETTSDTSIPYEVTARKATTSDDIDQYVRVYLTKGETEEEVLLDNYSELPQTDKVIEDKYIEKVIYTDIVPKDSTDYEETFRLRMWISDAARFDKNDLNNKTFTLTINVYANAEVVTAPAGPNTMTTSTALVIGTEVTAIDGSKWHVLEDSNENTETVVLLSDYNLNKDGTYNTECGRDINSTYTCSTMVFDSDNTNAYNENDSNNIGYFIKNTYSPLVINSLPGTTEITLPTAAQIAKADGKNFSSNDLPLATSWILTTNYWTKTATMYSYNEWTVYGSSAKIRGDNAYSSGSCGARPVITTPKTNLLAE